MNKTLAFVTLTLVFILNIIVKLPNPPIFVYNFNFDLKISNERENVIEIPERFRFRPAIQKAASTPLYDKLVLTNISNFYIDTTKSATFYTGEDILLMTFLTPTRVSHTLANASIRLIVKKDGREVLTRPIDVLGNKLFDSPDYIFSIVKESFRFESIDETRARLSYHLSINGMMTDEFPIKIVNTSKNDHSKLTARLIKCMWKPDDLDEFEFVMRLILESQYDSIYVCVFREETELRDLFKRLNASRHNIKLIEAENLPHIYPGREDFTSYQQIRNDSSLREKANFLDPFMEFSLNLIYPSLVEKYRFVHAADFDHILFTTQKNSSFHDNVLRIMDESKVNHNHTIYLDQYWALPNEMSRKIFDKVKLEFGRQTSNRFQIDQEEDDDDETSSEIWISIEEFNFELAIRSQSELDHAFGIIKYLENKNKINSSPYFRDVIVKFSHPWIFGQAVHNTKSSLVLKLCGAGEFFTHGLQVTVRNEHLIHYRPTFDLKLLRIRGEFIRVTSFMRWIDFFK